MYIAQQAGFGKKLTVKLTLGAFSLVLFLKNENRSTLRARVPAYFFFSSTVKNTLQIHKKKFDDRSFVNLQHMFWRYTDKTLQEYLQIVTFR